MAQNNNIGINSTGAAPAAQAILDVSSTTKGMLIPRLTAAQRLALVPVNGLTVYQTDASTGFYYYSSTYSAWFRQNGPANAWDIWGTDPVNSVTDFFGTTDNQPVVFKTNNIERMRFMGTTGYLGVGAAPNLPVEQLDVSSAIRIWPQTQISGTPGTSAVYSANITGPGSIMYQKDTYMSTATTSDLTTWPLLFKGHWGNIGPVSPYVNTGTSTVAAHTGGWRRLENDYTEVFNTNYTQQGTLTCANGTVEIPQGIAAGVTTQDPIISPYSHSGIRTRHQYLFRAAELNAEAGQLAGNPTTGGFCAGQPINQIAFYVGAGTTTTRPWGPGVITLKHAAAGLNDLSAGFDNSLDLAQACGTFTGTYPATIGGWDVFNLSSNFVWNGTDNVIVEIVIVSSSTTVTNPPAVKYALSTGGFIATASKNGTTATPVQGCTVPGPAGSCGAGVAAAGMTWASACGGGDIPANKSASRPVIRFGGVVSSITAPVPGIGNYIRYYGGLIAETTTNGLPWGRRTPANPVNNGYYSFRGPGTVSAEKGIYDNGVRLNDHVFDRAFDGQVSPSDADLFGAQRNLSIPDMADFTRMNRHLPTMKGRASWAGEGGFGLGDLTNQLWTTAETQALYMTTLHDRLNVLEMLSDDRPLSTDESALAREAVRAMATLSEAEKALLLTHLQSRTVEIRTER
ncbi:MAG: hypothetical protein JST66_12370 [Bacteroidetes bacterium]|nr:hypothetical protein [Bacteroidota bacterium]